MNDVYLNRLFNPSSIAIIGASPENGKIGNVILKNIKKGFRGRLYAVNPKYDNIEDIRCYSSVLNIECDIDIAVIALSSKAVMNALVECKSKGVGFVIIIAGGFAEIGIEGMELEDKLKDAIKGSNTQIRGPNTVGIYLPMHGVSTALTVAERSGFPAYGDVAYISQSGALGLLTLDSISYFNMRVHSFINLGNRADIDEIDLMKYLGRLSDVRAIMMYIESFKDGRSFFNTAREITCKTPVIILKGGATESGYVAASHHTGAMMQNGSSLDGIFRQCGVIRAKNETELIDYAYGLAYTKRPKGANIAVITSAGGVGVVTSDLLSETDSHLKLATLSDNTMKNLMEVISSIGSVHNPVDMTVEATNSQYDEALSILNEAEEVDGIILYALFQSPHVDKELIPVLEKWKDKKSLVVGTIGGKYTTDMIMVASNSNIPIYPSIERSVKVMDVLYKYELYLEKVKKIDE
jgi:acyl-CoA synthetase (NDP forming)